MAAGETKLKRVTNSTPQRQSTLENALYDRIRHAGLPEPEREFRFCEDRKFRVDFAWPVDHSLLVDVEGGIWSRGKMGHSSGSGIERDIEKANIAQLLGYTLLRVTEKMILSGEAIVMIKTAMARDGDEP